MIRRRMVGLLVGLLVGAVMLAPASAGTITMQQLIDGASFQVGDKIFYDWTYEVTGDGDALDPEFIVIDYWEASPTLVCLDYQTGYTARDGSQLDIRWNYKVMTETEAALIEDISASLTAFGTEGAGTIALSETIFDSGNDVLADLVVSDTDPSDHAMWDPAVPWILVEKNLFLDSQPDDPAESDLAHVSGMRQCFSQVPEASTCALLILGLAGVSLFGRFRKR